LPSELHDGKILNMGGTMPRLAEKYGYRENYNNTVYMPRRTYINAAGAKVRDRRAHV